MRHNISAIIIFALILSLGAACNRKAKVSDNNQEQSTSVVEKMEQQSRDLHDKLMSSFNPNWEVEEPAATDYPAYYGGSFIDNEGRFVVCIVGNPEQYRPVLASILGTNDFLTESCTYSTADDAGDDRIDQFLSNPAVPGPTPFLAPFCRPLGPMFLKTGWLYG